MRKVSVIKRNDCPLFSGMVVRYHPDFALREKLLNKEEIPLLSARDIMDFLVFKFYREMTEERMLATLKERHRKRQLDIDLSYSKMKINVLK